MPENEDKRFYKERKYESEAFWSSIGTATVFTIIGIISIILAVLDNPFLGLAWWGFWLFIPAFFIYIGAISTYFKNNRLKAQVLAAIVNYYGKKVVLENLAAEVMMPSKDLMRVLIDLRTEFKIKFRYDNRSGELILGEEVMAHVPESSMPSSNTGTRFCRACGRRVDKDDSAFCTFCGSQL
ncbi:MAG: zinc ribbon domain-containing protein [Candidatus Lokiarchaeota archaeon]|nr:zinc ribbon domain-containing protein [Candidatus Lokiarchaeota archaeon]